VSTDPTSQQADQPPSQPTTQPTLPPASPNTDQQYASSARLPRRLVRLRTVLGLGSVIIAYLVAWAIVPRDDAAYAAQTASV
jgi:hypothetical protein